MNEPQAPPVPGQIDPLLASAIAVTHDLSWVAEPHQELPLSFANSLLLVISAYGSFGDEEERRVVATLVASARDALDVRLAIRSVFGDLRKAATVE